MHYEHSLEALTDDELLRRLVDILAQSRRAEADLVSHIGEVERRLLFAREASPLMFAYCTEVLHLPEAEAYLRIGAARAAREHPVILNMLADGRLHLSGIAKLAPHLTPANRDFLLQRAAGKTKRQIEELLVEIAPRPDVPTMVRKLPAAVRGVPTVVRGLPTPTTHPSPEPVTDPGPQLRPDGAASTITSGPAPVVQPLAPARYKIQFTASASLEDKLKRLQALMPGRDLVGVIEQAVTEKLERLETRRFGKSVGHKERPVDSSRTSRYITAGVRRAVTDRDGQRCCYVDDQGRRCPERLRLEFHHRVPYGVGGDRSVPNIALMCPAHNQYLADCDYGRGKMARHRRSGRPSTMGS